MKTTRMLFARFISKILLSSSTPIVDVLDDILKLVKINSDSMHAATIVISHVDSLLIDISVIVVAGFDSI